jgi:hypothetical protein
LLLSKILWLDPKAKGSAVQSSALQQAHNDSQFAACGANQNKPEAHACQFHQAYPASCDAPSNLCGVVLDVVPDDALLLVLSTIARLETMH